MFGDKVIVRKAICRMTAMSLSLTTIAIAINSATTTNPISVVYSIA